MDYLRTIWYWLWLEVMIYGTVNYCCLIYRLDDWIVRIHGICFILGVFMSWIVIDLKLILVLRYFNHHLWFCVDQSYKLCLFREKIYSLSVSWLVVALLMLGGITKPSHMVLYNFKCLNGVGS